MKKVLCFYEGGTYKCQYYIDLNQTQIKSSVWQRVFRYVPGKMNLKLFVQPSFEANISYSNNTVKNYPKLHYNNSSEEYEGIVNWLS